MTSSVQIKKDGIFIDNKPLLILCSSLFYFRIPKDMWRDRMQTVKESGYNCIDVYFPWNYHELREGEWDFTNEKNIKEYLKLAAEYKLFVIARPGPYICSEWDAGGLPAYLFTKDNLKIRDYNKEYLRYVREWYSRIMPIIAEFQYGNGEGEGEGGTVVAVQIENELDFYNCPQVKEYMGELREMAIQYGVQVPILACAGQGDLVRAGGTIDGVIPAVNLYPDQYDDEFEYKLSHTYSELNKLGFPVCVTETNRSHFLLRRLLCNGVKLIGPYNQGGGTNFGFTTAINNWGNPLSFLTHDYSFGGMITPQGTITEEYFEGKLFSGLITSFGENLALAEPVDSHDFIVKSNVKLTTNKVSVLKLKDGGYLLGVANMDHKAGEVQICYQNNLIPQVTKLRLNEQRCPIIPVGLPLDSWGVSGIINYCTAEIVRIEKYPDTTIIVTHTECEGEISLTISEKEEITYENMSYHTIDEADIFTFEAIKRAKLTVRDKNGNKLIIIACSTDEAANILTITADGDIVIAADKSPQKEELHSLKPEWSFHTIEVAGSLMQKNSLQLGENAGFMEKNGLYRGFAWYGAEAMLNQTNSVKGYLLHHAADIISTYIDNKYIGTVIPGGNCMFIDDESTKEKGKVDIKIRAEIWGHSNFDDSRLPSLKIDSLKGLSGMTIVTNIEDLSKNWRYFNGYSSEYCILSEKQEDTLRPLLNIGTFNNPEQPQVGYYKKRFRVQSGTNSWILELRNLKSKARVYIDGKLVRVINDFTPSVLLEDFIKLGYEQELIIFLEQKYIEESKDLKVLLYEGIKPEKWCITGAAEKELWQNAIELSGIGEIVDFPIAIKSGEIGWIKGSFDVSENVSSYVIEGKGKNAKLTVFVNGHMLGRAWLMDNDIVPILKGGRPEILYLPNCWLNQYDNLIAILIEALNVDEDSEIMEIKFSNI